MKRKHSVTNHLFKDLQKETSTLYNGGMQETKKLTDRIVFMGSPEFCIPSLEALYHRYSNNLVGIFTQPDRPKGRNKKPTPTPVKKWGIQNKVPIFQSDQANDITMQLTLLEPTLIIVIAFGLILPKNITDHFNCLNVHASLLPKYRGASPIQASLLEGDTETGISLIKMTEKLDDGPILAMEKTAISKNETFGDLQERLRQMSATCLLNYLETTADTKLHGTPQNHPKASYCYKIRKEELQLDWTEPPKMLLRKIKAFSPLPGAYTITQKGQRIKILDAKIEEGQLIPITVKPEGKQTMTYKDFCRGNERDITC